MQNDRWDNYVKMLSSCFGENSGRQLFTIQCGAFTCSVLRECGYRVHYPVAVVVNSLEEIDILAEVMGIFSASIFSSNLSFCKFKEVCESCKDDTLMIVYCTGRNTDDNMHFLRDCCLSGQIGKNDFAAIPILIFNRVVPENLDGKISILVKIQKAGRIPYLGETRNEFFYDFVKKVMETSPFLNFALQSAHKKVKSERIADGEFFDAVLKLLELTLGEQKAGDDNIDFYGELADEIQQAYWQRSSCDWRAQALTIFTDALEKYAEKIPYIFRRDEDFPDSLDKNRVLLFNENYYYFPELLFTLICKPIEDICSVNEIKSGLEKAGVLCTQGEGRVYRTIKVQLSNGSHFRYVWLRRDKIDSRLGELSLEERIKLRGGKRNEGND